MSEALKDMIIKQPRHVCKKIFTLNVKDDDFFKWKSGSYIQVAFPYLSAGERELLISNTCDTRFDRLFPPEE